MPHRWSAPRTIALILIALACVAAAIYFASRFGGGPSADEVRQLVEEKNVGLGYLENQTLDDAVSSFEKIRAKLPADPLSWRNLAIARVLALGDDGADATLEKLAAATSALKEVSRLEGASAPYHWLSLQTALAAEDFAAAQTHLNAIQAEESGDAAAWFAKFSALERQTGEKLDPPALQALEKACQLRPENAWLRVEWLRAVGTALLQLPEDAGRADAAAGAWGDLAAQLDQGQRAIEPFAPLIQTHTKVDALALLSEAKQAVADRQWREAGQRMLTLANVLVPHAALDRMQVRRHPLEFVATEFQPQIMRGMPPTEEEKPIAVSFRPGGEGSESLSAATKGAVDFALADFDLDGRLDVVALLPDKIVVLSRGIEGQDWQTIASAEVSGAEQLLVQDLDSDFDETVLAVHGGGHVEGQKEKDKPAGAPCPTADVDIVAYGQSGVMLLENRFDPATRSRTLVAVPGEKLPAALMDVATLAAADLEGDGDLDLVLAAGDTLHRWMNGGEWTFLAAASDERPGVTQILPLDFDRDIDIDLLIASPNEAGWLENVRHGGFRWRPFARDFPDLATATALESVDFDGTASWDLVAATDQGLRLVTTRTPQPGDIRLKESLSIASAKPDRLAAFDYDNDGHDDLLSWTKEQTTVARCEPASGAAPRTWNVETPAYRSAGPAKSAAQGDLDNDGDLDIAVLDDRGVSIVMNDGGNQNHWIDVALQAQQLKGQQFAASGRVSPYGVGSLLELKAGPWYQARVVRGQSTHFGIGQLPQADVVRVVWLNGVPQNMVQPAANLSLCEQQVLTGSCPYLYAWDGERFVFLTDLLWNAPIGLQLAEGVLAPARDWEYLKLSGEKLAPEDGHYALQLTEELWEAAYFDHVRMIAVDHPAEVEIYSNEKVGPPDLAQYKIHTVRQPRPVVAARNHNGRDLLSDIASHDGIFAKVHDRKLRQGLVEEGYLELDLGDLARGKQITLFLTGWVYPAATSINVALSQAGSLAPARPPALLVPDGNGGWNEALPFMGFPGGKTKTIAVDLTDVLAEGDSRVRIATTMELYWDRIFFTVDEAPAEVRTQELDLVSADLHDRGFSRVVPDPGNGPERFLYDEVLREPKWPPMAGAFTRLGDVQPLLTQRDDHLLVIGAGDEVTLRFRVPDQPPPAGWKRDFLFYSVGWDKDCNLLTVLGETTEPLPFEGMPSYPWPPGEAPVLSPEYQDYLRTYQTRHQSNGFWRLIQRFP
ncbi:MAG TPA: CRTAC1 family protein [Pirellulaceae bacterium]|nr:CRTAC1 family protein [Pirellulaceae bacterium]